MEEELLSYAVLIRGVARDGFSFEQMYEAKLHELFLGEPDNLYYLELELMASDLPKTICYLWAHINWNKFDQSRSGKTLMDLIRPVYHSMNIRSFGSPNRVFLGGRWTVFVDLKGVIDSAGALRCCLQPAYGGICPDWAWRYTWRRAATGTQFGGKHPVGPRSV